MKSSAAVTHRTIATQAGCSQTTVSFALKNDPRIPASTRRKIQSIATELGYRPNPLVATLMAQLKSIRKLRYVATLGWIQHHSPNNPDMERMASHAFQLAASRASELGYEIEPFWIHEPGMSAHKLDKALHARRIQGVILAPWVQHKNFWPLRWDRLSAVTIGHSPFQPVLHKILPDDAHNVSLCLKHLREQGYHRIGLVIPNWILNSSPFLLNYFHDSSDRSLKHLLLSGDAETEEASFGQFMQSFRPEVLICINGKIQKWLTRLGLSVPKDIGLAYLDLLADPECKGGSGINIHLDRLAISAVDMLVGELQNNRLGPPSFQKGITIQGDWVQGKTLLRSSTIHVQDEPAKVVGILVGVPIHQPPFESARKLIQALAFEIVNTGSPDRQASGTSTPWISRIYHSLSSYSTHTPWHFESHQKLKDDLRYHDFVGWILVHLSPSNLLSQKDVMLLPYVQAGVDCILDLEDFRSKTIQYLAHLDRKEICYLHQGNMDSNEHSQLERIGRNLGIHISVETFHFSKINVNLTTPEEAESSRTREVENFTERLVQKWKRKRQLPKALIIWEDVRVPPVFKVLKHHGILIPDQITLATHSVAATNLSPIIPIIVYEWPLEQSSKGLVHHLYSLMKEGVRKPPTFIKGKIIAR